MWKILVGSAFVASVFLGADVAQAKEKQTIYDCAPGSSPNSFVAAEYIFVRPDGTQEVYVQDSEVVKNNKDTWFKGVLVEDSAAKLIVRWSFQFRDSVGNIGKAQYRAVVFKSDGKVLIDGQLPGFTNSVTGRGKCTVEHASG